MSTSCFQVCGWQYRIASAACVAIAFCYAAGSASGADVVFPGATWDTRKPHDLGLNEARLDAVATALKGRGCVVKDGFVVKAWGEQGQKGDWASSAKPVLSTLLMFARHEGKIKSFDQPVIDFGWELLPKDRSMTLRHLASMTSGYARPEKPGAAWAYNDYAIQLYQKTLFDKIFQGAPETVFNDPQRFGRLQFEDGFSFRQTNRRMRASVRDFARVAWFWLNRGNWNGAQLLPREYFDENMKPQVPKDLSLSSDAKTNDYLQIGTYGGESNHFSKAGPGIYGFNWWFNGTGGRHPNALNWPDAPTDTVMSLGRGGNCTALMPGLNMVVVAADADWGELDPGNQISTQNQRLKLIAAAGAAIGGD
jgi:CubicO group peptidase (beta-lactamase class C family)